MIGFICASKVHSCSLHYFSFFCPSLFVLPFTVPWKTIFAKPEDVDAQPVHLSCRVLSKVSCNGCLNPYQRHSPYTRCSDTFGSTSSQRPALISLILLQISMTHMHTAILIREGSASFSPLTQEICCYLFISASALSKLQLVVSHDLRQLRQAS